MINFNGTVIYATIICFGIALTTAIGSQGPEDIVGTLMFLFLAVAYFMPCFVAGSRLHRNRVAIAALNTLLGWTFLGWVLALVWSFTANTEQNAPQYFVPPQ